AGSDGRVGGAANARVVVRIPVHFRLPIGAVEEGGNSLLLARPRSVDGQARDRIERGRGSGRDVGGGAIPLVESDRVRKDRFLLGPVAPRAGVGSRPRAQGWDRVGGGGRKIARLRIHSLPEQIRALHIRIQHLQVTDERIRVVPRIRAVVVVQRLDG